jgi:hypothetical protein
MQGRPVNELLDVPVERPTVDQLKIEVGSGDDPPLDLVGVHLARQVALSHEHDGAQRAAVSPATPAPTIAALTAGLLGPLIMFWTTGYEFTHRCFGRIDGLAGMICTQPDECRPVGSTRAGRRRDGGRLLHQVRWHQR